MRGSGGSAAKKLKFFQHVITKNSILEHKNQIFASQSALCLDQTFTLSFSKLH